MYREGFYRTVRPLGALIMGAGFRMSVAGSRRIPQKGPFLVLAKHQRWEDIPLLGLAIPRPLCYVAKYELFRQRLPRRILRALGGIPLNRKAPMRSRRSLRQIRGALKAGCGLVVFPEGTYYPGVMGPAHLGMVRFIMQRRQVPVMAAGLSYSGVRGRPFVQIRFGPRRFRPAAVSLREFLADLMEEMAVLSGMPAYHPDPSRP